MTRAISKSKYLNGLQCPKLLWNHFNAPDHIPPHSDATLWIFDQGHEVGALAQKRYPGGVEVPMGAQHETVSTTRDLLERRVPIYEASFLAGGAYCRVDVLVPVEDGRWDLVEVKSTTSVKDEHIDDVALQLYCLRKAGLQVRNAYLMHLNNEYRRQGEIDVDALFQLEDVGHRAREQLETVGPRLREFHCVLREDEPEVLIGDQCDKPHECPLKESCWAFLPEHDVTTLHRERKLGFELIRKGVFRIAELDPGDLKTKHRIQHQAITAGSIQVRPPELRDWLDELVYPLHMLDFEAMSSAIPWFEGTRPWEQVPFQASVHTLEAPDADPVHREFLATGDADPRPDLVEFLTTLPGEGSVLAWHASYERRALQGLRPEFPQHQRALDSMLARLEDLEEPFRGFALYHPGQRGRTSIKAVLPALTEMDYESQAIQDGGHASRAFLRIVRGEAVGEEADKTRRELHEYCALDTLAMVEVLRVLYRLSA